MSNKYLKYQVEDWVVDDDFIRYVEKGDRAMASIINDISIDAKLADQINEARKIVGNFKSSALIVKETKLDKIFDRINDSIDSNESTKEVKKVVPLFKMTMWISGIAASIALFFIFNPFSDSVNDIISTQIADHQTIKLPDESIIELNNESSITYDSRNWNKNRNVQLKGEAFFKVAKGSKFTVKSPQGSVSVLGTQFNIYDRNGIYEVECLEGKVKVEMENGESFILIAGDKLSSKKGQKEILEKNTVDKIDWLHHYVNIKEMSMDLVLEEISRYYKVEFQNSEVIKSRSYTGFFTTNSLDSAIYQVLWPLDIPYTIEGNKVIIK